MKQNYSILLSLFLIISINVAFKAQTIRYVKPVATGTGNGSTWTNASNDIQSMINVSAVNDEIWVAMGTYKPNSIPTTTSTTTPRNRTFFINNGVKLYGGFTGSETLLSQRNFLLNITTLSGDFNGDDIVTGSGASLDILQNTENAYHVILAVSATTISVIDGFTIKGGNANTSSSITVLSQSVSNILGGGVHNFYSGLIVDNCIIKENLAKGGAGIYNYGASVTSTNCNIIRNLANGNNGGGGILNTNNSSNTLSNCKFVDNTALNGGAISNFIATGDLSNCTFSINTANGTASHGGAIYNDDATLNATGCVFTGNSCNSTFYGGGALYGTYNGDQNLTNCVFTNNSATISGGAIYNDYGIDLNVLNSTFFGNIANGTSGGGAIYNNATNPIITNSIIWGNTGTPKSIATVSTSTPNVSYSIIEGAFTGTANLASNPLFVNSANPIGADNAWRTADDGLRLKCASPGYNTASQFTYGLTDIIGVPRPQFGISDMGAYESGSDLLPTIVVTGTPMACGSVSLTATGGSTYTWSGGQSPLSSTNTFTTSGAYNLTVTAVGGCSNTAINNVTVTICTGVSEITTNQFSVYPNPVSDIINIQLASEPSQNQLLEIYDVTGKLILKQLLVDEITSVKISHLENGLYLFKILKGTICLKTGKILKQ